MARLNMCKACKKVLMKVNRIFFTLLLITGLCACRSSAPKKTAEQPPLKTQNIQIVQNYTQAVEQAKETEPQTIEQPQNPAPIETSIVKEQKTAAQKIVKEEPVQPEQIPLETPVKKEQPVKQEEQPNPQEQAAAPQQITADKNIINDDDGRLTHPWALAPGINFPAPMKKPAWFGESLTYSISWAFITAGEATISTGKTIEADGQAALEIKTTAQSYSVLDKMFKVRDINISWLAPDGSKSLGYWQSVREGSYARDEWIVFDYPHKRFITYKKNRKGELSNFETELKKDKVFDMLTALYFVRMQPLPVKGEVYFDIVNGGKEYPLKVIVHGKEKVKVKAGTFNCILVEPVISGDGIFVSKGKSLKVWLTDDEYKMPVKMSVEVFIGSVKGELTKYSR